MNLKLKVVQQPYILILIPSKSCSGEFLDSLVLLMDYCYSKGIRFTVLRRYSPVIYFARNLCLGGDVLRGPHQKPFNGIYNYTHMLWLDDDIFFKPYQFQILLNLDQDIVSGIYKMVGGKYYATVKDWDEGLFLETGAFRFLTEEDIKNYKGLMDIVYTGFGFMLIKRGVFESLTYPWFKPKFYEIGNCVDFCSEDVGFCKDIKEKGYKIYIDPRVRVGHLKETVL